MIPTKKIQPIQAQPKIEEINPSLKPSVVAQNILDKVKETKNTTYQSETDTSNFNNFTVSLIEPLSFNSAKRIKDEEEYLQEKKLAKTINFSVEYLKEKLPGFPPLYYREASDLLSQIDTLTVENFKRELEKFNYVDGIQSLLSKFTEDLIEFNIEGKTLSEVKNSLDSSREFTFFGIRRKIKPDLLNEFNKFSSIVSSNRKEIETVFKNAQESKRLFKLTFSRFTFFKDFLNLIVSEILSRGILSEEQLSTTVLMSRSNRFNTSSLIADQYVASIDVLIQNCKLNIESIDDYLNNLKPSLDILFIQDKEKFFKMFKEFLEGL